MDSVKRCSPDLGSSVGGKVKSRPKPGEGADVDDGAQPAFEEMRSEDPAALERLCKIDVHYSVPFLRGHTSLTARQRRSRLPDSVANAVHDDVQRPKLPQ
jgi:hypothetical protein